MRNDGRLSARVAIITGAGSGLGKAAAILMAREGARTVLVGRNAARLEAVVRRIRKMGGNALSAPGDVTKAADCERVARIAGKNYRHIDILVNAAGVVARDEDVAALDEGQWDTVIDTDLKGAFLMCRAVVPSMRRARRGAIVNVASIFAFVSAPGYGSYSAAKGGLVSYTRALALDLAPHGVRVNAVCPGHLDTPMLRRGRKSYRRYLQAVARQYPLGGLGRPSDVAPSIVFLASEEAKWITGVALVVDGGFTIR